MQFDARQMMLNEASILGHVEAKTPDKTKIAEALVGEGVLFRGGSMSRGGRWYKPTSADHQSAIGPRVRFIIDRLGSSEADDLTHCTIDDYGTGDEGIVAFEHPNPRLAAEGWIYVEVDSKTGTPRKLYVGVPRSAIEAL